MDIAKANEPDRELKAINFAEADIIKTEFILLLLFRKPFLTNRALLLHSLVSKTRCSTIPLPWLHYQQRAVAAPGKPMIKISVLIRRRYS